MDRNWLIHESRGSWHMNCLVHESPEWLEDMKLFSANNSYMLLCNTLSNIFPATGSKDTGR